MSFSVRGVALILGGVVMTGGIALSIYMSQSSPVAESDLRNGRVYIQENLSTANGKQYAVLVAPDGTPYAAVRSTGASTWRTVDLSELGGNPLGAPTENDLHNVYALGVDSEGGVHIAGNMLSDPLRYARSDGSLGAWSTRPAPQPSPDIAYPSFVHLADGGLMFLRRIGSPGSAAIYADLLPSGERDWQQLGPILDGRDSQEGPYAHRVAVDEASGAIHLMYTWRSSGPTTINEDVEYATSPTGGRTWERADGTTITPPIEHGEGDLVIDTAPAGSGLVNQGGLTVDSEGRPHAAVTFGQSQGDTLIKHVWHDGDEWLTEDLPDTGFSGRAQIAATDDGLVWLLGVRQGEALALDVTPGEEPQAEREIGRVPGRWELSYDSQALNEDDVLETLVPDGKAPRVLRTELEG